MSCSLLFGSLPAPRVSCWRGPPPISAFGPFLQSPCRGRRRSRRATPGAFAPNTLLSGLRMIDTGSEVGPEHIAMGPDGKLYAAMP